MAAVATTDACRDNRERNSAPDQKRGMAVDATYRHPARAAGPGGPLGKVLTRELRWRGGSRVATRPLFLC